MYAPLICPSCGAELLGWLSEQCAVCGMELEVGGFEKAMHAIESGDDETFELEESSGTLSEDEAMSMAEDENGMTAQDHVSEALRMIPPVAGEGTIAERMAAALWPYIVVAAEAIGASPAETVPGAHDKRSKPWQYVVRFWRLDDEPELIGETEPAIMTSTGQLPKIVTDLAAEMHDGEDIEALSLESIKALLPQFRNNLGRGMTAVLRIPYEADGIAYRCQADVYRLDQ